jgi:hypothetical protein
MYDLPPGIVTLSYAYHLNHSSTNMTDNLQETVAMSPSDRISQRLKAQKVKRIHDSEPLPHRGQYPGTERNSVVHDTTARPETIEENQRL